MACRGVQQSWEPQNAGIRPLEGGGHYLRLNYREGTQPDPSTENWINNLQGMALPIRAKPKFLHRQSHPSGSFYKPLSLSSKRQTEWKPQSQETNQTDNMDHSFV